MLNFKKKAEGRRGAQLPPPEGWGEHLPIWKRTRFLATNCGVLVVKKYNGKIEISRTKNKANVKVKVLAVVAAVLPIVVIIAVVVVVAVVAEVL